MQDYPKLLLETKKEVPVNTTCLVVTFPRFMAWSPVKNDYTRAALLKEKTGFEESPRSGEADIMELFKKQILSVNDCPCCSRSEPRNVVIEEGAHICLWPESGVITEEIHSHIGSNVVIKKGSVLVVRCRYWFLENVEIDGCCILGDADISTQDAINGTLILKNVKVHNKGWHYVTIDPNDTSFDIVYRMRGYVVDREEQCIISVRSPSSYTIENQDLTGSQVIVLKN